MQRREHDNDPELSRERHELLRQVEEWLDRPMLLLGLLWLLLMVFDMTVGLSPLLNRLFLTIWAIFIVEFALRRRWQR